MTIKDLKLPLDTKAMQRILSSQPPHKDESMMNKTVWESKISEALKSSKISYSEYFDPVESVNSSVVVDYIEKDEFRSYLKIFFYVQRKNVFQPSPSIVYQLNQIPGDWLAIYLGMPIIERPKVYDIGAYEKEDDFIWIIGIVVICFPGILLICWCFIFLYTFFLQATAMVNWLPKPMISDSKQIFYKTENSQREVEEKRDSQVQTDNQEFSQPKTSKAEKSLQNKSVCDRTVLDSDLSEARLSTVSEISLEESVNPTVSELNESVVPLSETQVLLPDEEDGIINQQLNEIKVNTKNLKNEVIEENEGDLLQATEIDKTLTFGSFDNVIPFVMSVPPRPEALKLANLLNSQKGQNYNKLQIVKFRDILQV
ncbi:hypothetical protein Smp_137930 [Schistosoma mansoni]|uniref:hypothetical protein n=1 Tax=Schistosoma mansoni TaxID=6183 RepID=UPI0001A638B6|nr:hypothetical protein Smp_137930 [Schistosoma mansoni]|eukprot:XP_018650829.1 hypothetical protein Smp_137930 [Schistosoma mansoni]